MTKVWAHRGASGYAPENSMEAFQIAVEMGADGIELDVQLTKDGEIVVIHDEFIQRVSNGKGKVCDYTLSELRKFNFNKTHQEFVFIKIPTLKEVLEFMKPTAKMVNIELKTGAIFYENIEKKVLDLVEELNMQDQVIYSSFNHYTILNIQKLNPKAKTGFLYADGIIDIVKYAKKHHVYALHPAFYNLQYKDFVKEAKEAGIQINAWTINEEDYMEMACIMGVDAMITNYPDKALAIVEQYFYEQ